MKNAQLVSDVCQRLAEVVGTHAGRGELPVTIGGDHSLVRLCLHHLLGFGADLCPRNARRLGV
jgi:arginase